MKNINPPSRTFDVLPVQKPLCDWAMNSFPVDSYAPGAQFLNVTASIYNDRLRLSGTYRSPAGLIPVLLFSVGVPWEAPCVLHMCCLWDVARRYRDNDLAVALGPTCVPDANLSRIDLLKGSEKGDTADSVWTVDTLIHPSFVAMLFVTQAMPGGGAFYMYHQVLPLQWIETSNVRWRSTWYGQPCHTVLYPNGQQVCIACFNTKPDNAVFVFSANWFTTFQCKWVCRPGFTGPNCEVEVNLAIYVAGTLVAALFIAGMVICMLEEERRRKRPAVVDGVEPIVIKTVIDMQTKAHALRSDSSTIVFNKDMTAGEIRIKFL